MKLFPPNLSLFFLYSPLLRGNDLIQCNLRDEGLWSFRFRFLVICFGYIYFLLGAFATGLGSWFGFGFGISWELVSTCVALCSALNVTFLFIYL